jgi:hypothetical protein
MNSRIVALVGISLGLGALSGCRDKAAVSPVAPDWMEPQVSQQATAAAPGSTPVGTVLKSVAYEEDEETKWPVMLEPNKCYVFSGIGDQGVQELFLELDDPQGDRAVRLKNDTPRVVIEHCTTMGGSYQLMGKVTEGSGHYMVGVFLKPGGPAVPPPPPAEPVPVAVDLGKIIDGLAAKHGAERVGDFFAGNADETDWYAALETGKCYFLIGAGDDGVSKLSLYLWDPQDKRITQNKSETNQVELGHCPTASGMYHFQAKVHSGSGAYKVGVYAKAK